MTMLASGPSRRDRGDPPTTFYERRGKRVVDVVVGIVLIVATLPILTVASLLAVATNGRPVLFHQTRIGRSNRPFAIVKLRTMPPGTPEIASTAAMLPMVTPFGRVLRRTNIDELPQLWLVLTGAMSLIGPRPALPSQHDLIARRTASGACELRPGLTGLAQLHGYDDMPVREKAEWDARYASRISFGGDLRIVLRTFPLLLRRPAVY